MYEGSILYHKYVLMPNDMHIPWILGQIIIEIVGAGLLVSIREDKIDVGADLRIGPGDNRPRGRVACSKYFGLGLVLILAKGEYLPPVDSFPSRRLWPFFFIRNPAFRGFGQTIKPGYIRLYIEQGRCIKNVYSRHCKQVGFAFPEPDNRHSDSIGPAGMARGKDTV